MVVEQWTTQFILRQTFVEKYDSRQRMPWQIIPEKGTNKQSFAEKMMKKKSV